MLVAKQKKSVTDFDIDVGNKRLIFHVQNEIVKILQIKKKLVTFATVSVAISSPAIVCHCLTCMI